MHTQHANRASDPQATCLELRELQRQLDVVREASEAVRAHLEAERDQAAQRGDSLAVSALEQGVLQATRVCNDVRCACQQLERSGYS